MLNIVMALDAEAEPIVHHFDLTRRDSSDGFKTYGNDGTDRNLVISGVGRDRAATATAFLAEKSRASPVTAWVNVGIGGQRELSLGTPVLANRIIDDQTESIWYPSEGFEPGLETAPVRTVEQPVNDYPTRDVYDMEASGFYAAARQVSSQEFIHVIKIISDNHRNGTERISRNRVSRLITERLPDIESTVRMLQNLTPA